jgi:hypothetical protein
MGRAFIRTPFRKSEQPPLIIQKHSARSVSFYHINSAKIVIVGGWAGGIGADTNEDWQTRQDFPR